MPNAVKKNRESAKALGQCALTLRLPNSARDANGWLMQGAVGHGWWFSQRCAWWTASQQNIINDKLRKGRQAQEDNLANGEKETGEVVFTGSPRTACSLTALPCGEDRIRTCGTSIHQCNCLAGSPNRPLWHLPNMRLSTAERVGFEPTVPQCDTLVFKTNALNHSAISPSGDGGESQSNTLHPRGQWQVHAKKGECRRHIAVNCHTSTSHSVVKAHDFVYTYFIHVVRSGLVAHSRKTTTRERLAAYQTECAAER